MQNLLVFLNRQLCKFVVVDDAFCFVRYIRPRNAVRGAEVQQIREVIVFDFSIKKMADAFQKRLEVDQIRSRFIRAVRAWLVRKNELTNFNINYEFALGLKNPLISQ